MQLVSTCFPASGCEVGMSFELILGAAIAAAMLVYLVFPLLQPRSFELEAIMTANG